MRDAYVVELLDGGGNLKRELPAVMSGQLSWRSGQAVPGSGSVQWTRTPDTGIEWLTDRIRITHVGATTDTPLGEWLPSMPGWETAGPVTHATIALSDKTALLNWPIGDWLTLPKGTAVTTKVAEIVQARGGGATLSTDSAETLTKAMSWEPSDTWLTVVNDLLAAITYLPLTADPRGRLTVEPYIPPEQRTPVAVYGGGADELRMRPQWSDTSSLFSLPTGVRLYVAGGGGLRGFVGAADLPDGHPLSAANRGGVPYLLTESSDATTRAKAATAAQKRLDELMQVARTITVTHPVDAVEVGDTVTHGPLGVDATVSERSVSLAAGAVVTDSLQHTSTDGSAPWPLIA